MSDDRKATEVLLAIEQRVARLEGFMQNMDNLLKIILNRVNSGATPPAPPVDGAAEAMRKFDERPKTNFFAQMRAQAGIAEEAPRQDVSSGPSIGEDDELVTDPLPQGQKRGGRVETSTGDRVRVTQHVTMNDQPILMAVVEVFHKYAKTTEGEPLLVGGGRTKPRGRWMAALSPGEYVVHVMRRPTETNKRAIDVTYELSVPPANEDYEAPVKELG